MSKYSVPRDNHKRTKYYYFFGFFYPSTSRLSLSPQQTQGTIPCGGLTVSETGLFDPQVAANSISQRYNTSGRFDLVSFQEVSKAQFDVMLEPSKK